MGSYGKLARRALETDMPVMVQIQELIRGAKNAVSLAQGVVFWQPPKRALDKVKELVWEPSISRYGADEGIPELREALIKKLHNENKLYRSSVMVTAGANQAFVNLVLTLCDAGDSVVMFAPYYFNAYMSFQMTGITNILVGPGSPKTLYPDIDWLERTLLETKPAPKLVTVVNPGNPSGTYIPEPLLKRISDLCRDAGSWLVVDNTYEYFMYDGLKHSCVEGDHIVNIFSFSKAYGMMGWRVGYVSNAMVSAFAKLRMEHWLTYPKKKRKEKEKRKEWSISLCRTNCAFAITIKDSIPIRSRRLCSSTPQSSRQHSHLCFNNFTTPCPLLLGIGT